MARAVSHLRKKSKIKKISKGVYTLPFEFVLPASLPSSTKFPRIDRRSFKGRIKVSVVALAAAFESFISAHTFFSSKSVSTLVYSYCSVGEFSRGTRLYR